MIKFRHIILTVLSVGLVLLLSGCSNIAMLNPKGEIAQREMWLLLESVGLMLIIVIPTVVLSLVFAFKYRAKNKNAKYTPNWSHSNIIEVFCWTLPCIIIVILSIMTWVTSHSLDPYKPLNLKNKKIITIDAIALNWKWLFIYPKQHIASVNYLQIPVNTQIRFLITSDGPMNSLEMPQLAGQIFAMAGMRTQLHFVANYPGLYDGFSANYSGEGFTGMKFKVKATDEAGFEQWVQKVQQSPNHLTVPVYMNLMKNSEDNPVKYFSHVVPHLFKKEMMKFMMPNSPLITQAS